MGQGWASTLQLKRRTYVAEVVAGNAALYHRETTVRFLRRSWRQTKYKDRKR